MKVKLSGEIQPFLKTRVRIICFFLKKNKETERTLHQGDLN